jgi:hypothetical protein
MHRPVRQHPGSAGCRAEEGGLIVIADIRRGEIFIEELLEIALDIDRYGFAMRVNLEQGGPVGRIEKTSRRHPLI